MSEQGACHHLSHKMGSVKVAGSCLLINWSNHQVLGFVGPHQNKPQLGKNLVGKGGAQAAVPLLLAPGVQESNGKKARLHCLFGMLANPVQGKYSMGNCGREGMGNGQLGMAAWHGQMQEQMGRKGGGRLGCSSRQGPQQLGKVTVSSSWERGHLSVPWGLGRLGRACLGRVGKVPTTIPPPPPQATRRHRMVHGWGRQHKTKSQYTQGWGIGRNGSPWCLGRKCTCLTRSQRTKCPSVLSCLGSNWN